MTYTVRTLGFVLFSLAVVAVASTPAVAKKQELPKTTKDGLELQHQDKHGALYARPGASLADYKRVAMTDVYVAFRKNWQRDYNRDEMGLENRVTDKDVDTIKKRMAEEFKTVFTEQLQKAGYEVTDEAAGDVLLLRPGIINLVVTAPDLQHTGMRQEIVASAGQMTLYMELYDSVSSEKLAEVIDAEADRNSGIGHMADRVTNKQAADRILRDWADALIKHMGKALE